MEFKFPEGFYWGASTSSHQVEGNNQNNWSRWEDRHSLILAKSAKRKFGWLDNWEEIRQMAEDPSNYRSGLACDHYRLFEKDFDLARDLSHNAHRLSLEWSRIETSPGVWDEKAIEHYRSVIRALRTRGMEPFVTIWHWTIPTWLEHRGGLLALDFPVRFTKFAEKMATEFGDEVKFWITLNEPEVYTGLGFLLGEWPPGRKNVLMHLWAAGHLLRSHKMAYTKMKQINPNFQIGIAKQNACYQTGRPTLVNRLIRGFAQWWTNDLWLTDISNHQDFVGINYYFRNRIDGGFHRNENDKISDLGWEIYPQGLTEVLVDASKYGKPIYITETGVADAQDTYRPWYVEETIAAVARALQVGVEVRGYFHWSLLDNFEWDKGFWPRFGLIAVDYKTQKRTIRESAKVYSDFIRRGAITLKETRA